MKLSAREKENGLKKTDFGRDKEEHALKNGNDSLYRITSGCPCEKCEYRPECAAKGAECSEYKLYSRLGRDYKQIKAKEQAAYAQAAAVKKAERLARGK